MSEAIVEEEVEEDVETVMRAARVISAIVAQSVAQTGDAVSMPQLRVLVLIATRPEVNASAVAAALGIHLSNASRLCDRLVREGLIDRSDSAADRRNLKLSLTPAGSHLIASIMDHRRSAFRAILQKMPLGRRAVLKKALEEFAETAGEPPEGLLTLP
jgi:DNA-binding MarR family transcriptional regulator